MLDFDADKCIKFAAKCRECIHYIENELCPECEMEYSEVLACGMFIKKEQMHKCKRCESTEFISISYDLQINEQGLLVGSSETYLQCFCCGLRTNSIDIKEIADRM